MRTALQKRFKLIMMKTIKWKLFFTLVFLLLLPWAIFQVLWMHRVQSVVTGNLGEVKQEVGQYSVANSETRSEKQAQNSRLKIAIWGRVIQKSLDQLEAGLEYLDRQVSANLNGGFQSKFSENKLIQDFLFLHPELVCIGIEGQSKKFGDCPPIAVNSRDREDPVYSKWESTPSGLLWKLNRLYAILKIDQLIGEPSRYGFEKETSYLILDNQFQIFLKRGNLVQNLEYLFSQIELENQSEIFQSGIFQKPFSFGRNPLTFKTIHLKEGLYLAVVSPSSGEIETALGDYQFARYLDNFIQNKSTVISKELALTSLLILGIVLIATFLVAGWLSSKVTRPINAMKTHAEKIAHGDLESELEVKSDDEIGELAQSINQMVRGLRDRESIKQTIGRAVSPEVFEAIMSLDEKPFLHGEQLEVTILVGDFRGFTSASERMRPEELIGFLNSYFSRFVDVIYENGGTLDKYLGDGIMVVFGAPVSQKDHADRALTSALEILRIVDTFNEERLKDGRDLLNYGIGLNSGKVVAGRIGTKNRFDYTVIGDSVNLAFRTQELCKKMESRLLLTENTKEALTEMAPPMEFAGTVAVRGRKGVTNLFTVSDVGSGNLGVNRSLSQKISKREEF